MSYKVNCVIILIIISSFGVNLFNMYKWYEGQTPGTIGLVASTGIILIWLLGSFFMGFKKELIYLKTIFTYWIIGIILAFSSYILSFFDLDIAPIIECIVCFVYTGQLYGVGFSFTSNVYFNPGLGVLITGVVFLISILAFFVGCLSKKRTATG